MRNTKGQFVKGQKNGYEENLKLGRGWNKNKKGWTNKGSFKKGHLVLDKTKEAVSIRHTGNTYRRGTKHTEKAKEQNRLKHLGKTAWNKGMDSGVTPRNKKIRQGIEFRLWRDAVFARDNWTDQKTGIRGGKLHPHHILNFAQYPELRFAIDNGITLSEKAHKEFHKKYGNKNNTREQLLEFIGQNI